MVDVVTNNKQQEADLRIPGSEPELPTKVLVIHSQTPPVDVAVDEVKSNCRVAYHQGHWFLAPGIHEGLNETPVGVVHEPENAEYPAAKGCFWRGIKIEAEGNDQWGRRLHDNPPEPARNHGTPARLLMAAVGRGPLPEVDKGHHCSGNPNPDESIEVPAFDNGVRDVFHHYLILRHAVL